MALASRSKCVAPIGAARLNTRVNTIVRNPLSQNKRSAVLVKASSVDQELEEIDPITGMPIVKTAAAAPVAGYTVQAGGYQWAYRRSEPDSSKTSSSKPQVLLLHGLGSSSYCWRNTLGLLGGDGFDAFAPDWIGHGTSDKPTSGFDYSEGAYLKALDSFVDAAGIRQPFALVVHGYILGQYGLLYALANPDKVDRILILNTPVSRGSKLRPELAAYKNPLPFMRPGNKTFDGANYNANGSPYAMEFKDADVYAKPYAESPAASQAIAATMDKVDFGNLLQRVDEGFVSWRKPSALLFGSSDPFLDVGSVFQFLESKRTNMKAMSASAKLGHMPQEDYAEALHDSILLFLTGSPDDWLKAQSKSLKMTKKGAVEV
eukprot:CAMPEP_0202894956 /NCGR_PEP_ID=MMETSP1392-20130828/4247_1 /ASSEMBLY_ACC=CAM_ASM_000868 /TAXON_ID=225041 /ORGANISM="Chlamydomonas chlamydogama, Strain SAG 11-48b" /LENGTH=374 /DNA_ID=CAMNT_0049579815 /DNA_START=22 /DNA_END=1146 /DNA_ORIENTATION=-